MPHPNALTCAVLNGPCYIVSDAHPGVASPQSERSLIALRRGLAAETSPSAITGALFTLWTEVPT